MRIRVDLLPASGSCVAALSTGTVFGFACPAPVARMRGCRRFSFEIGCFPGFAAVVGSFLGVGLATAMGFGLARDDSSLTVGRPVAPERVFCCLVCLGGPDPLGRTSLQCATGIRVWPVLSGAALGDSFLVAGRSNDLERGFCCFVCSGWLDATDRTSL